MSYRNSEGYKDFTAGKAITRVMMVTPKSVKRGAVHLIDHLDRNPSMAVMLSDGKVEETIQVVFLSTKPRPGAKYLVPVYSTGKQSFALCGNVTFVDRRKLGSSVCQLSQQEMATVDAAISESLHLGHRDTRAYILENFTLAELKELLHGGG